MWCPHDISQLPDARSASAGAGEQIPRAVPGAAGQPPFWLPNCHKQCTHMYRMLTSVASKKGSNRSIPKGILLEQKRVLTKTSAGDFQFHMG